MNKEKIGFLILRLSMAAVYLYFGFSQLFDGINWVGMVPEWAINLVHLPPAMLVLSNGLMEVVLGTLLAIGVLVRPVAIILAIHLLVIASGFGLTPAGVRDFGLTIATLSLAFLGQERREVTVD